jgi:NAD(P)H-quinone oxidoreductase subunit 5
MNLMVYFALAPALMMGLSALLTAALPWQHVRGWRFFKGFALAAVIAATIAAAMIGVSDSSIPYAFLSMLGITVSPLQALMACLVQLLGWVIGLFSARYLEGEQKQQSFVTALSMVLASVHVLLIADHWLLFVAAWSAIGFCLKHLLCFYEDRPFALLASHKKTVADLLADSLLILTAMVAYVETGSAHISVFLAHVSTHGLSQLSAWCALLLVGVVILRTALLPVHGWLIQVMEAPTPVSALLHAGVVNLSGYVLIRFAPLFEQAVLARHLLLGVGLITCLFASLVMFTRVSIKVRLAWSTVAQMGFMVAECALGLYTFAALHLVGHSIYKAYAFLSAAEIVSQTRVQRMAGKSAFTKVSLILAPVLTTFMVFAVQYSAGPQLWPAWWSLVLALAWAPLLWQQRGQSSQLQWQGFAFGTLLTLLLTLASVLFHHLPLGLQDHADPEGGWFAVFAMVMLYAATTLIQWMPERLAGLHRWVYAGFYLDEFYTRWVLRLWPVSWGKSTHANY